MKLLGIGLSGLVGSRVGELLLKDFQIQFESLETGLDITNKAQIETLIATSDASWVLHFAAYTNVDGAEIDKNKGKDSVAWKVNAAATETIASACLKSKKKLLYVSTDYVFDGQKTEYSETDEPNPQGWYGITKYEGEKQVGHLGDLGLIIRIANPYRRDNFIKPDFVRKIMSELSLGHEIKSPKDQIFVPTFIDDIASATKLLIQKNEKGIYHVVGGQSLTPFIASLSIAKRFGFNLKLVNPTTFVEYFSGRAHRPFHAALLNGKITKLGINMVGFNEGLNLVSN